ELHEHEGADALLIVEDAGGVGGEKCVAALARPVEDDADVSVAGGVGIGKEAGGGLLNHRHQRIAQPVERLPQGGAPFLVPAGAAARASAVGAPALDAVEAAP